MTLCEGRWKMALLVFWIVTLINSVSSQSYLTVNYQIREELDPQTSVGNIAQSSGLNVKYNKTTLQHLNFRLLQSTSGDKDYFSLRENGMLYISKKIDRDSICRVQENCTLKFDIIVQPHNFYHMIKVTVNILDLNDNVPSFPVDTFTKTISEAVPLGFKIMLPQAMDPDGPENGLSGYHLDNPNPEFELIHSQSGLDGLYLKVKSKLDREIREKYIMKLTAFDGGKPPKKADVKLEITISDVNDNSPHFLKPVYEIKLNESAPLNSTVVVVHASDEDAGANGQITYKFTPETINRYGEVFRLNNTTGYITLVRPLDFQQGEEYTLIVQTNDGGQDSLRGQTKVIIHVTDLNNHAPVIMVSGFSNNGEVQVSEAAKGGTYVAHLFVTDKDGGRNGEVECSLQKLSQFKLEKILAGQYQLANIHRPDYEKKANYSVSLMCWDAGVPRLSTSKEIIIKVLDENEIPEFEQKEYKVSINENNQKGLSIIQVSATDKDFGPNGIVTYSVQGNYTELFSVDIDGLVRAERALDREKYPEIEVTIQARDQGSPSQSSTVVISITLVDINDSPPRFPNDSYEFSVVENSGTNMVIGTVWATDNDSDKYNKFYFSLSSNDDSLLPFTIDPEEGIIFALKSLDREEKEEYKFDVVARDALDFSLSSHCPVTLRVLDMNDHVPYVKFPSADNNTVYVSKEATAGTLVTSILAKDDDLNENAKLSYKLFSVTRDNLFFVNDSTGDIMVNQSLSALEGEIFNLAITISDSGFPVLSTIANLNVIINNSVGGENLEQNQWQTQQNIVIISAICALTVVSVIILVLAIFHFKRRSPPKYITAAQFSEANQRTVQCQQQAVSALPNPANQRVIISYHVQEPLTPSFVPAKDPLSMYYTNQAFTEVTQCGKSVFPQKNQGWKELDVSMVSLMNVCG